MWTLGIETSSSVGSLALFKDKTCVAQKTWAREGSHSEFITVALMELLSEAKISLKDLNRLAVGQGPGSFTGIRVGINFARTLGQSLRLPIFQMNSLRLLSSQRRPLSSSDQPQEIVVMQFAFRNLIYFSKYSTDQGRVDESLAPLAVEVDDLQHLITSPALALGSGFTTFKEQFPSSLFVRLQRNSLLRDHPLAEDFSGTMALDESPDHLTDWIHTIPLYIRASEAEEKLRKGLLKSF